MKDLPILTKNRLKSVGIYRKLTPQDKKLLREGALVELKEHVKEGDNPMIAVRIASQHISERKDYYKKLKKAGL